MLPQSWSDVYARVFDLDDLLNEVMLESEVQR